MMNLLHHPLRLLGVCIVVTLLFFGYRTLFRPDPQVVFQNEVKQILASVNQGSHTKIEPHLSASFVEMLRDRTGLTVRQATILAKRRDLDGGHQYRLANNPIFEAKRYAEVEIDRSDRGGEFTPAYRFAVPFIWTDGKWKVAGGFQTQNTWKSPFQQ